MKIIKLISLLIFLLNGYATMSQSEADAYFAKAESYKEKSLFDSALYYFKQAATYYVSEKETLKELDALNQQSYILSIVGSPSEAIDILNKTLKRSLKIKKGENAQTATCYHVMGVANYVSGNYQQAIEYTQKGYNIRKMIYGDDHKDLAKSLNNLGILYGVTDDLGKALEMYETAHYMQIRIYGERHIEIANSINNLGVNAYYRGDYERAILLYDSALNMFVSLLGEKHKDVATQHINIGTVYNEFGEYQKAVEHTLKAKYIYEELYGKRDINYLNVALNLSAIYKELGDPQRALIYALDGFELAEYFYGPDHPELAKLAQNIGVIYDDLDDINQAIEWQEKSLKLNKLLFGENNLSVAYNYNNIGTTYEKLKDYDNSEAFLLKSAQIKESILGPRHVSVATTYNNLANIYFKQGLYEKALHSSQAALIANHFIFNDSSLLAIPSIENYSHPYIFMQNLIFKAEVMTHLYESGRKNIWLKSAKEHLMVCQQLINTLQLTISSEDKIYLSEVLYNLAQVGIVIGRYEEMIDGKNDYLLKAFEFVENSKAAILNASIEESRAKQFSGIPNELLEQEKNLNGEIQYYNQEISLLLDGGASESDVAEQRDQLFKLKQQYSQLIKTFEQNYPKYYKLKYDVQSTSIEKIQSEYLEKKPKTAIVEYIQKDSIYYAYVITHDNFQAIELSATETERNIRGLRNAIIFHIDDQIIELASQLYMSLFAPIDNYLQPLGGIEELVIIPDGILGYVPFEILVSKIPKNLQFSDAEYLLTRYNIIYAMSATIMVKQFLSLPKYGDKDYVAFAPVFSDESETNYLVNTSERFYKLQFDNIRGLLRDGKISSIPSTKEEVEEIDKMYKKKNLFAKHFLFKDAKEENVKDQSLGSYRYIHMATHGFVNDKNPDLSGLVLSQNSDSNEDGILFVGEIYNLKWNAELVALSACETGLGKVVKGEGILGLTRAFMYAGAENVLVSLWKVSDESTSKLMIEFYNNLLEGESKSSSLRNAKLQLIGSNKFNNPYYWAPFILIGN
jgi:CHAT domain-containing protein